MSMQICTLVLQFNYTDPRKPRITMGSVWLFNGDGVPYLHQLDMEHPPSEWVKIIGRVDYETATLIHASLKRFFEQSGVTVIDEGITD